jgi:phosphoribosylformylglycinamidine synthase
MQSGWVRACHDLSEGGLAVAAAEMCIAGRLGLDLAIRAQDPEFALFGAVNACLLVEVPPAYQDEFEAALVGLPCQRIGKVMAEPHLTIRVGTAQDNPDELWQVSLPVSALLAAWKPEVGGRA